MIINMLPCALSMNDFPPLSHMFVLNCNSLLTAKVDFSGCFLLDECRFVLFNNFSYIVISFHFNTKARIATILSKIECHTLVKIVCQITADHPLSF